MSVFKHFILVDSDIFVPYLKDNESASSENTIICSHLLSSPHEASSKIYSLKMFVIIQTKSVANDFLAMLSIAKP